MDALLDHLWDPPPPFNLSRLEEALQQCLAASQQAPTQVWIQINGALYSHEIARTLRAGLKGSDRGC